MAREKWRPNAIGIRVGGDRSECRVRRWCRDDAKNSVVQIDSGSASVSDSPYTVLLFMFIQLLTGVFDDITSSPAGSLGRRRYTVDA